MADDASVNDLIVYLSNPNRKAEEHVVTVMEMVRQLAKYKHELNKAKDEAVNMRNMLNEGVDPMYHPYRGHRAQTMEIPENARSVEVKF